MDNNIEKPKNAHYDYCMKMSEKLQREKYEWLIENNVIDMNYEEYKEKSKTYCFGVVIHKGPPTSSIKKGSYIPD
jgi:hypothetical protein